LGIEMLKQVAGIDLVHVPYRGGAPAGTATVAGETHVVLAGTGSAALIKSGKLRPLATTGTKRSALLPQTPPIGEFYPSYDLTIWQGVFAPAGTPEPTLSKVRAEIHRALGEPDLTRKINASAGMDPLFLSSAQFTAVIRRDYEKYGKLVQDLGVRID
jgi:tripartite-type tricarboxylate transporter receptor subunit TctC